MNNPTPTRRMAQLMTLVAITLWGTAGCQNDAAPPSKGKSGASTGQAGKDKHDNHHHAHGEKGPHGGALVAIGDDAAHLEVVLDAETGKLTAYILDAAAEKPLSIKAVGLDLAYTKEHEHDEGEGEEGHKHDDGELPETGTLALSAVSPGADGMASEFAGQTDELKGASEFDAVLTSITIGGKEFTNVKFNYPEGNEHDHHHH
jgi:hypothetical protein